MVVAAFFFAEIPLQLAIWGVVNCSISRGKNGWRETIASTASEYPLAIFGFREPSPLNPKNACWEHPKP